MTGFVITDAAAKMAKRLEVVFNQEQADAMRRRVAELEAEILTYAAIEGLPVRVVARRRLAAVRTVRFQRGHGRHWSLHREIIGLPIASSQGARECDR